MYAVVDSKFYRLFSSLIYSGDTCGGVRLDESGLRDDETICVDGLSKTAAIVASSFSPRLMAHS